MSDPEDFALEMILTACEQDVVALFNSLA